MFYASNFCITILNSCCTRLAVFSGEEIARIMEAEGFIRVRQKGSHLIMQKRSGKGTVTVEC